MGILEIYEVSYLSGSWHQIFESWKPIGFEIMKITNPVAQIITSTSCFWPCESMKPSATISWILSGYTVTLSVFRASRNPGAVVSRKKSQKSILLETYHLRVLPVCIQSQNSLAWAFLSTLACLQASSGKSERIAIETSSERCFECFVGQGYVTLIAA